MAGYRHRCCAKTVKGTRCKLSNAFTGAFCHIHAPRLSTGEVCTDPDNSQGWEAEQELLASKAEVQPEPAEDLNDSEDSDDEYNPCARKYSPQPYTLPKKAETEPEFDAKTFNLEEQYLVIF